MLKLIKFTFFFLLINFLQNFEALSQSLGSSTIYNIGPNSFITGLTRSIHVDVHKPTGKIVYVWVDTTGGSTSSREIFCEIYNKDMTIASGGSRFRINKNTTNEQLYPKVKVNQADNSFTVIWSSRHSGDYDIYAKRISFNATFSNVKNSNELLINNVQTGVQITPLLTFDYFRNELIVAWRDDSANDGAGLGAFFRRIAYNSDSLTSSNCKGNQVQINQYTTNNQLPSCIEVSPITGELVTLCQAVTSANTGYDVVRRIFTYNSTTDAYSGGTESTITDYTTDDQYPTCLLFNSKNGDYSVAWTSASGDGDGWGAYFKIYNKLNTVMRGDLGISNNTAGNQHSPRIVWDEENNILTYFYVYSSGSISTYKYRMYNSTGTYTAVANESDALTPGPENTQNLYGGPLFPVYNLANRNVYLAYDLSNNFLVDSKGRARVYAYSNPNFITKTISYTELKEELDASYSTTIKDTLYFKYNEKYNQGTSGTPLNYKIYDYKRSVLATASLTKKYGINFFKVNLKGIASLNYGNENYYILEVVNDKGELKMLRFRYVPEY